jgi:hypothetical protein
MRLRREVPEFRLNLRAVRGHPNANDPKGLTKSPGSRFLMASMTLVRAIEEGIAG